MTNNNIKVKVFRSELITMLYPVPYIIQKLKDADIPVLGILLFAGIKNGILEREESYEDDSYIFTWYK